MNLQRQLLALLAFCLTLGANAQTEVVKGEKVPRLSPEERNTISDSGSPYAKGQLIYNTDTNCLEYWNGDQWVSLCDGATTFTEPILPPKDETGQYRLSGKTCYDVAVTDDPVGYCMPLDSRANDFADGFTFNYTFSGSAAYNITDYYAIGDGKNLLNLSRAGNIITATFVGNVRALATNTTKALTLIVTFDDNNNEPKYVSIDISVQDCSCGCPVKTVDGGWLTFLCYNLGADPTMTIDQQMAYTPTPDIESSTDSTVYGGLYQWGRNTDGHEKRTSGTTPDLATTDTPEHGNFITTIGIASPYDWRSGQNPNLWQPSTGINNPCPAGYRVPTQAEWQSIYKASGNGATGDATANKWTWNWSGTRGYKISPDNGTTTTLFLPAAGHRSIGGTLSAARIDGYYWSSTVIDIGSYNLVFSNSTVYPGIDEGRVNGMSIRCVSYQ